MVSCVPAKALVKARGDGLGFDLSKAEFHFEDGIRSDTASVWIDGQQQTRWDSHVSAVSWHALLATLQPLSRGFKCWVVGIVGASTAGFTRCFSSKAA